MPTSLAAQRRAERGLPNTLVDPALSEKRRKATAQRADRKKSEIHQQNARIPKGGKPHHLAEYNNKVAVASKVKRDVDVKRAFVRLTIVEAAQDAAGYLIRLVRGEGDCAKAPHAVRRLAAVDLLTIGGVAATNAADDSKDLADMTVQELQAHLQSLDTAIEGESKDVTQDDAAPHSPEITEKVEKAQRQAFE